MFLLKVSEEHILPFAVTDADLNLIGGKAMIAESNLPVRCRMAA